MMITATRHRQTTQEVTKFPKCFNMTEVITLLLQCALKNFYSDFASLLLGKRDKTFSLGSGVSVKDMTWFDNMEIIGFAVTHMDPSFCQEEMNYIMFFAHMLLVLILIICI